MTHNTINVYALLKTLINDHVKTRYPFLKSTSYFSDGSPAQYKNYKNFANQLMHKKDFEMKAEWHFFATSHGKNVCDGVGGTIKRLAAHASLQRAIHYQILNPHQLYDFAKSDIRGITCFFVDKKQVDVVSKLLAFRYENARQVRGSRKNHQFIPNGDNILMSRILGVNFSVSNLIEDSPASINIEEVIPRKFYACCYENDWYFGMANYVSIESNDVNVKFMHP